MMTVYIVTNYAGGTTTFKNKWKAIEASQSGWNQPFIETTKGKRPVIHLEYGYEIGEFGETYAELSHRMLIHYRLYADSR